MLPLVSALMWPVGSRYMDLSQWCAICPYGPERNRVAMRVIWWTPASAGACEWAGLAHCPVHVSRDGRYLLPWVITVGNGRSKKALLHSVTAGPSFHFLMLSSLPWENVLFIILLLPQDVLHHMLEHRRQLPGSHRIRSKHLAKPIQSDG